MELGSIKGQTITGSFSIQYSVYYTYCSSYGKSMMLFKSHTDIYKYTKIQRKDQEKYIWTNGVSRGGEDITPKMSWKKQNTNSLKKG